MSLAVLYLLTSLSIAICSQCNIIKLHHDTGQKYHTAATGRLQQAETDTMPDHGEAPSDVCNEQAPELRNLRGSSAREPGLQLCRHCADSAIQDAIAMLA